MSDYIKEQVNELAEAIKAKGFRVFIANRGTYGFFTDTDGARVISFQYDLGVVSFSGNYKTPNPRSTGTGWRISEGIPYNYDEVFSAYPPQWATRGVEWEYTTLDQHLETYNKSSKYMEV